jgi:hypothetical protein
MHVKKKDREAREARAAMLSAGARAAMREVRTTSAALAEGGVATTKAVLNDQGVVVACASSAVPPLKHASAPKLEKEATALNKHKNLSCRPLMMQINAPVPLTPQAAGR